MSDDGMISLILLGFLQPKTIGIPMAGLVDELLSRYFKC